MWGVLKRNGGSEHHYYNMKLERKREIRDSMIGFVIPRMQNT